MKPKPPSGPRFLIPRSTRAARCYIAGPMTGIPGHNYPAFNALAAALRDGGYEVFNPAENFGGDTGYHRSLYFRADLPALLQSDSLILLPGWRDSVGASLEVLIADTLDLPIYEYDWNTNEAARFFPHDVPCELPFQKETPDE